MAGERRRFDRYLVQAMRTTFAAAAFRHGPLLLPMAAATAVADAADP